LCYVDSHDHHKCTDVKKAVEQFRQKLEEDIDKLRICNLRSQKELTEMESDKDSLIKKVSAMQNDISQNYDQLISMMKDHQNKLIEELNAFKSKKLQEIENNKEKVETQFALVEDFRRYCDAIKEKGTAYHISRDANNLHVRAEELINAQEKRIVYELTKYVISFTPLVAEPAQNIIGCLDFGDQNEGNFSFAFYILSSLHFLLLSSLHFLR